MDLPHPKFRSASYRVAQSQIDCPFCGRSTRISAVILPPGHEVLEQEGETGPEWQAVGAHALLFYIAALPRGAEMHLRASAPGFHLARSEATQDCYWANHCEHCNSLLEDHELHCEPGEGFVPISAIQGSSIDLRDIPESCEVSAAGYSLEPQFLPFIRYP